MPDGNAFYKAAVEYARRGWSVVPLVAGQKTPIFPWARHQTEKASLAEIKEWWTKAPNANVGIVTGAVSGIIVLDVDGEKGAESLHGLEMPPTMQVRTGKGAHHYYKHPAVPVRGTVGVRPGLDLRGDGNYVVAPPSKHPSGAVYEWAIEDTLADPPKWLLKLIQQPVVSVSPTVAISPVDLTPPEWHEEAMQGVPVGQRNITAARLLGRWLGLGATSTEAWALLKAWNHGLDISLDEKELQIIFNSIAKAEATKQQFRKQIDGVKEEAKQAITQAKEGAKQTVTQAQEELKARLLRVRQEAKEGAKKQAAEAKEKAKEKITEVKEKAKKVPDPEVKSEDYSSIPKPTLCAAITANLGLPVNIIEVVKYLGDPPKYYLIFDNGRRASLGSGGGILNQRVFQEAIVNALNIAIVPLPKKQWAGVVQLVLAAVEERELGPEGTETGSIYMALINYLKEHPPQEEDKIEEPDSPFHFKGDVYIFLSDFVAHLWRSLHEKHTTRSLTGPMALLGAENRRIWRNKKEAAAYKRERVSVYRIPQNIIEEVDSKE